jgi:hypothetical protein
VATSDKSHPKLELELDDLDSNWSIPAPPDVPGSAPPPPPAHALNTVDSSESTVNEGRPSAKPPKSPEIAATMREMSDYLESRDWSLALVLAEQILAEDNENPDAKRALAKCQAELETMYATRLGSLAKIPALGVSPQEITSLALDSRSAFILGLVDGMSTIDMVLDMSGIPRLDTLRVLLELVQQGVLKIA